MKLSILLILPFHILKQLELSLNMIIHPHPPPPPPTSALSYSRFWSQNGEWFSKGSSGPTCVHRQTDRHENCTCTTSYTHKHYVSISEQYLQKCRSNALDNNDLIKFTNSRGDNSATNDSMVMKIAHAELYTTSNIVCNLEFKTCNTVGLFLWTTIIQ